MRNKIEIFLQNHPLMNSLAMFLYRNTLWLAKTKKANIVFRSNAEEVFLQLHKVMTETNMQWWLEYGTLLGAVRDGSFISHDTDIDIGLLQEERFEEIEKIFIKYGFKKKRSFLIKNTGVIAEETYVYKNIGVDLFYFEKKQDALVGYGFRAAKGMTTESTLKKYGGYIVDAYTFPYRGFKEFVFFEKKVLIPLDEDGHLTAHYGNWKIKNKKWNFISMAKNRKVLKNHVGIIL